MLGIEHKLTIKMGNQNCSKINDLNVTSVCGCMGVNVHLLVWVLSL